MHRLENEYTTMMKDALEKWGYESQRLIWIEEMSELIKAIAKRNRRINPSYDSQIENELADVDICFDQMKIIFNDFKRLKIIGCGLKTIMRPIRWINRLSKMIETLSEENTGALQTFFDMNELDMSIKEMKSVYPNYETFKEQKIKRLERLVYQI